MVAVVIGPCRIADSVGTHEPGDIVENPSNALLNLAESKTADPETGLLLVKKLSDAKAAAAIAANPDPTPDPTPAAAPEKT